MEALRDKARELLAARTVQVVIGYGRGSGGAGRAAAMQSSGRSAAKPGAGMDFFRFIGMAEPSNRPT